MPWAASFGAGAGAWRGARDEVKLRAVEHADSLPCQADAGRAGDVADGALPKLGAVRVRLAFVARERAAVEAQTTGLSLMLMLQAETIGAAVAVDGLPQDAAIRARSASAGRVDRTRDMAAVRCIVQAAVGSGGIGTDRPGAECRAVGVGIALAARGLGRVLHATSLSANGQDAEAIRVCVAAGSVISGANVRADLARASAGHAQTALGVRANLARRAADVAACLAAGRAEAGLILAGPVAVAIVVVAAIAAFAGATDLVAAVGVVAAGLAHVASAILRAPRAGALAGAVQHLVARAALDAVALAAFKAGDALARALSAFLVRSARSARRAARPALLDGLTRPDRQASIAVAAAGAALGGADALTLGIAILTGDAE